MITSIDEVASALAAGIRQLRKEGFAVVAEFPSDLTGEQKDTRARLAACRLLGLGESDQSCAAAGVVARALLQNCEMSHPGRVVFAACDLSQLKQAYDADPSVAEAIFENSNIRFVRKPD